MSNLVILTSFDEERIFLVNLDHVVYGENIIAEGGDQPVGAILDISDGDTVRVGETINEILALSRGDFLFEMRKDNPFTEE